MKDNIVKEQFIELRAKGLSFTKISEKLDTSKPVLMKWEKELKTKIKQIRFLEFEALREKYSLNSKARLEAYGDILTKAKKELEQRDFKEMSTDKLVTFIDEYEGKFFGTLRGISCDSDETKKVDSTTELQEYVSGKEVPVHTWNLVEN